MACCSSHSRWTAAAAAPPARHDAASRPRAKNCAARARARARPLAGVPRALRAELAAARRRHRAPALGAVVRRPRARDHLEGGRRHDRRRRRWSSVDGIHDLDQRALGRMLYAWCSLAPGCYTQGLNFFAAVLLAVMLQSSGLPPPLAEERAFWTFCAALRVLYPADFHRPPFAGLQRLAGQMSALAAERLAVPAPSTSPNRRRHADHVVLVVLLVVCRLRPALDAAARLDELLFTSGADGVGGGHRSARRRLPSASRCCAPPAPAAPRDGGTRRRRPQLRRLRGSLVAGDAAARGARSARRGRRSRAARILHRGGSGRIGGGGFADAPAGAALGRRRGAERVRAVRAGLHRPPPPPPPPRVRRSLLRRLLASRLACPGRGTRSSARALAVRGGSPPRRVDAIRSRRRAGGGRPRDDRDDFCVGRSLFIH